MIYNSKTWIWILSTVLASNLKLEFNKLEHVQATKRDPNFLILKIYNWGVGGGGQLPPHILAK